MPQEDGVPEQLGAAPAPAGTEAAKVENFFSSWAEPQAGHLAWPCQSEERTSSSLSLPHFWQWNSYRGMSCRG